MFLFGQETHTYTLDGVRLPSVTEVLPYHYFGDCERQRVMGTHVHRMIHLYNVGDLDEESLDPLLVPYLDEYRRFRQETASPCGLIDIKTGHPHPCTELQLAAYTLLVKEGITVQGIPLKAITLGYEMPAYHPLYRFAGTIDIIEMNDPLTVGALHLSADGPYRYEDHSRALSRALSLRRSIQIFLSFLTTYQWKKENGL